MWQLFLFFFFFFRFLFLINIHELHSGLMQDGKDIVFVGISSDLASNPAAKDVLDGNITDDECVSFSDWKSRLKITSLN